MRLRFVIVAVLLFCACFLLLQSFKLAYVDYAVHVGPSGESAVSVISKKRWRWFPGPESKTRSMPRRQFETMEPRLHLYKTHFFEFRGSKKELERVYHFSK